MEKKQYKTPEIKVVEFRMELGFGRSNPVGLFEMELFDGRAREEQYEVDDWGGSSASPATDETQFQRDNWGTM